MRLMSAFKLSNPSFPIKIGSTGKDVKFIQSKLGLVVDGKFGPATKGAVQDFQRRSKLTVDGIVGPRTWSLLRKMPDFKEEYLDSSERLKLYDFYELDQSEYLIGQDTPEYIFIHHTAGWHNPYKTISNWDNDERGRIGTQYVIGGQSIKGNDNQFDGQIVKCMEDGGWAYHLGKVKSFHMHKNSIGIEVNNFGYLKRTPEGFKTWAGQVVKDTQVYDLGYEWRGHRYWHNYSDNQIESLEMLIKYLSEKYSIDLSKGLKEWISENPETSFDFKEDAYYGKVKGLLSHSNVRSDKTDMYPHAKLIKMIKSL
jgi:hypothetical protein